MISRRGGSSSSSGGGKMVTEYIVFNQNWTVPSGVKNNEFSVRIFGGGGSASGAAGGGSGWMNNDVFTNLVEDSIIPITIGRYSGTIRNESNLSNVSTNYIGGTTSFGSYLSANGGRLTNGGSGGSSGGTNGWGGIGYQFGGGGDSYSGISRGGNGGVWGGGGGGGIGGHGGIYGGGGGANMLDGGNGGTYGGGGGSSVTRSTYTNYCNANGFGRGGTYGGNGGYCNYYSSAYFIDYTQLSKYLVNSQNGTNTSTWTNVTKDDVTGEYFRGWGIRGRDSVDGDRVDFGGGGGFGGNGGTGGRNYVNSAYYKFVGGGGGGYGSNGANAYLYDVYNNGGVKYWFSGGGGGYGGDGGVLYGGGGGYGKVSVGKKTDYFNRAISTVSISSYVHATGGGGYYCPSGGLNGDSGGGGIGIWQDNKLVATFGSGRSGNEGTSEPGICIIQYYV